MSRIIEPMKGAVLVKLSVSEFGDIPVPEKDYDSITWGKVVKLNKDDDYDYLLGREIYYRRFKDDARIAFDKTLVLIEIKDILGSSYDDEETHADSTSRN